MVRRLISCCMALLMLGCALAEDELDITYRFGSREEQKIAVTIDDCYHAEDVRAGAGYFAGKRRPRDVLPHRQGTQVRGCGAVAGGCGVWVRNRQSLMGTHLPDEAEPAENQVPDASDAGKSRCTAGLPLPHAGHASSNGQNESEGGGKCRGSGYLAVVKWDVSETDPVKALAAVQNGSILLFHARKKDAKCLSVLIPQLVAEGYQLVTVSELLGLPEIVCSAEKYVYHRRDTEENIRPDAVPRIDNPSPFRYNERREKDVLLWQNQA